MNAEMLKTRRALVTGEIRSMPTDRIVEYLDDAGMRVLVAASPEEALTITRFLFIDLVLVGLDGVEDTWRLIGALAGDRRGGHVICASADATRFRVISALKRGARAFLIAPFDRERLGETLASLGDSDARDPSPAMQERGPVAGTPPR